MYVCMCREPLFLDRWVLIFALFPFILLGFCGEISTLTPSDPVEVMIYCFYKDETPTPGLPISLDHWTTLHKLLQPSAEWLIEADFLFNNCLLSTTLNSHHPVRWILHGECYLSVSIVPFQTCWISKENIIRSFYTLI